MPAKRYTQWSTLGDMVGRATLAGLSWWPEEERQRIAAYEKYDQLYWNDPTQYAIRVLENEQPLYIPNARVIVDTTAHYLLKGLKITTPSKDDENPDQKFLDNFLKRERFYSRFETNKLAGIARGDWAYHITADPSKPKGSRLSVEPLHPGMVWKEFADDDPDEVTKINLLSLYTDPNDPENKTRVRRLIYEKVIVSGKRRIAREEALWDLEPAWHGPDAVKHKQTMKRALLPVEIDQFPVYWLPNIEWQDNHYGSSELRGLEFLDWAVSQGATDTQMALSLEGLGVYATDGGRPVDEDGEETDWEVSPGKVMEVPSGSYFRRIQGLTSVTPSMDQIKYLEQKAYQASAMTDVALGQVDVQVAQSGIALAIKFMPTLAKIDRRDIAGVEIMQQMFHDLKKWFKAYEGQTISVDYDIDISKTKLPKNRTETVNELNNMLDRKIITREYYREQMRELGYQIPATTDADLIKEAETLAKLAAASAPPALQQNAEDAAAGRKPITNANGGNNEDVDNSGNRSNNQSRPNESSGTESGQSLERQNKS